MFDYKQMLNNYYYTDISIPNLSAYSFIFISFSLSSREKAHLTRSPQ